MKNRYGSDHVAQIVTFQPWVKDRRLEMLVKLLE